MNNAAPRKRLFSFKFLFGVILVGALMPLVLLGWGDLWKNFLENSAPGIEILEAPRGIGLIPGTLIIRATDVGAGLDAVVVRANQKGQFFDIHKESFNRALTAEFEVDLASAAQKMKEGVVDIEIKAFDKSFWSNTGTKTIAIPVDYRRPELKVLTIQHNIRRGGSQLVLYEASDDNLGFHGVKVGSNTFLGVPARSLDSAFRGTNVYGAFFSVALTDPEKPQIRVFAEDQAGNANSLPIYHKILPTPIRPERIQLTENFLQGSVIDMYETNLEALQIWAREIGQSEPKPLGPVSLDLSLSVFKFVNQALRNWSELELSRLLHEIRTDRVWDGPFLPVAGTIRSAFGRKIFYDFKGETVATTLQNGYEISGARTVRATNRGIVVFVKTIGVYGTTVALDHGLGIYSLYSWVSDVRVNVGDEVEAGEVLAKAGGSGFSRGNSFLVHMRINEKPVSPREWWDKSWYYAHIIEKIGKVKRDLGLAAVRNEL